MLVEAGGFEYLAFIAASLRCGYRVNVSIMHAAKYPCLIARFIRVPHVMAGLNGNEQGQKVREKVTM